MINYIDESYILKIASSLRNFKRKGTDLYNFSCPVCGDSERNKLKARAYFYVHKSHTKFKCHNCTINMSLYSFIEEQFSYLYKEFKLDKFKEKHGGKTKPDATDTRFSNRKPIFKIVEEESKEAYPDITGLDRITEQNSSYLNARGIPKSTFDRIYYCKSFKRWTNSVVPGTFETPIKYEHPRIILPFFDENMTMFGFQGRALDPKDQMRYYTLMIDKTRTKVFGLESVDHTKKHFFVCEGPFDSLFIPNCIATAGSSYNTIDPKYTVIPDKEPRNREIVKTIEGLISSGRSIALLPKNLPGKDINDLYLTGLSKSAIIDILHDETCKGPMAKLKFSKWRGV